MSICLEEVSKAYDNFVEDPAIVELLKHTHSEYIKSLSIRKTRIIELYTTELYTIINMFLREQDTLQFYIYNFPKDTKNKRLSLLNLFQSVSYNYLNSLDYIDESDVQVIKKVSVSPTMYEDVLYPLLNSSIEDKSERIRALYYFRTIMSYYFLELNTILLKSPKVETIFRCFRGEKDGSYLVNQSSKDKIEIKGILSASLNKEIAEQYINELHPSRSVFLEILIHTQCAYLYIDTVSSVKGEEEVILSPFTQFTIIQQYVRSDGLPCFTLYATPMDSPVSFKLKEIELQNIELNTNMEGGDRPEISLLRKTRKSKVNKTPLFKAVKAYNGRKILVSTLTPFQQRMSMPLSIRSIQISSEM